MAKAKSLFVCSECGQQEAQWQGKCRSCGSWNSFQEIQPSSAGKVSPSLKQNLHQQASLLLDEVSDGQISRLSSGFREFDQVLGGGLVSGSLTLLGGEPGIGKSTLLLQLGAQVQAQGHDVLYISAEESALQVKLRAERLECPSKQVRILCDNHLETISQEIQRHSSKIRLVIVDSLQTIVAPELGSVAGTPTQLRHVTQTLQDLCRQHSIALVLIAHLTKDGSIAGPRTVEHMVDCVLYFEHGENDLRLLQANKNRFGSTNEVGLFEMGPKGLRELHNPQEYFWVQRGDKLPAGISIAPIYEGSRCLLVEVQALTVTAKGSVSRIFSDRLESARVSRLAAVLEKHTGVVFSDQDIYVNVAGGLKLQDIAVDLPLALALLSARLALPLPLQFCASGELSLAGELRPIKHGELRLRSAAEYGIKRFLLPAGAAKAKTNKGIELQSIEHISQVLPLVFTAEGKTGQQA